LDRLLIVFQNLTFTYAVNWVLTTSNYRSILV